MAVMKQTEKRKLIAQIIAGTTETGAVKLKNVNANVNPNIEIDDTALELGYDAIVKFMDFNRDGGSRVLDDIRSKLVDSVGGEQ